MKVKPLHDWTIIKRHESKEKTAGGIIIPDVARDIPAEGTVIAIGPGRYKKKPGKKTKFIPTILKPGQRIYFMEYATQEIELDGKEIIFIREEDILGTLEDDKQLVVKKSHPIEVKQEQPVIPHGKAATLPLVAPSGKEVTQKKPALKKKRVKKEKAVSRTRKPAKKVKKTTKKKTAKHAKKVTSKKTAKKALKKKTTSLTKKKMKTAKKRVKGASQRSSKGKKATPTKKSGKGSSKKKK